MPDKYKNWLTSYRTVLLILFSVVLVSLLVANPVAAQNDTGSTAVDVTGSQQDVNKSVPAFPTKPDSQLSTQDRNEPDGSFGESTPIYDGTYSGYEIRGGNDYFAITLDQGEELTASIDFDHSVADVDMALYDPERNMIENSVSTTDDESISRTANEAGTYYVRVYRFSGNEADYSITVETSGNDGSSFDDAIPASSGTTSDYQVDGEDDYYSITLEEGEELTASIAFDDDVADIDMELYDPGRNEIDGSYSTSDGESVSTTAEEAGTYYVRVYRYSGDRATYQLDVSTDSDQSQALTAQNAVAVNGDVAYVIVDGQIRKVDTDTQTVIDSFPAPSGTNKGLAYGAGSLWYADGAEDPYDGEILELDPDTGDVRSTINTRYDPYGLAFGDGSLYAAEVTSIPDSVHEFTPDGTEVDEFGIDGPLGPVGDAPNGLAYYDGSIWAGGSTGLYQLGPNGGVEQRFEDRETPYRGLAGTETALYGPADDGSLTVLRGSDTESEVDPDENDDQSGAVTIDSGTYQAGFSGFEDYFAVELTAGEQLTSNIRFDSTDAEIDAEIVGPNGNVVDSSTTNTDDETVSAVAMTNGTYYIHTFGSGSTDYEFDVEITGVDEGDRESLNHNIDSALTIPEGTYNGLIGGQEDYYGIEVNTGEAITASVNFDHAEGDVEAELIGPDNSVLDTSTSTSDGESVSATASTAGTYYLYIYRSSIESDATEYTFTIETPEAPDNNHHYEYVSTDGITWDEAFERASQRSHQGMQGYLATITTEQENEYVASMVSQRAWIGASDARSEGTWRWVTGPEGQEAGGDGRHFFTQTSSSSGIEYNGETPGGGVTVDGNFANWSSTEPNNLNNEDYAHYYPSGDWNDNQEYQDDVVTGFVVEYGGLEDTPSNDRNEPNDDRDTATQIQPRPIDDLQIVDGEADYYAFNVEAGSSIESQISFDHSEGDLDLRLENPDGQVIDRSYSVSDGESVSASRVDQTGTYYIHVYGFGGASANYDLDVDVDEPEAETELSGVVTNPRGEGLSGITVSVVDPETGDRVTADPATGSPVPGDTVGQTVTDISGEYTLSVEPGEYLLVAEGPNGVTNHRPVYLSSAGNQGMNIVLPVDQTDDENDEYEPNDRPQTATELTPGSYSDLQLVGDENDVYAVQLESGQTIEASIDSTTLQVDLYSPNLAEISDESDSGGSATATVDEAGTYLVRVYDEDASTSTPYSLDIAVDDTTESLGTVSGVATDPKDVSVSGVTIRLEQDGTAVAETTTTSTGEYSLTVPTGEYTLVASVDGNTTQRPVSIAADTITESNVTLTANPSDEDDDDSSDDSGSSIASREIDSSQVSPDGSVTSTVTITTQGSSVSLTETFSPELGDVTIDSVTADGDEIDPFVSEAAPAGVVVTAGGLQSGQTVVVQYTIEPNSSAALGTAYDISGSVTSGETTQLQDASVTVSESSLTGAAGQFDANQDGNISISELGSASAAYARGELSISDLGRVASAYAS